MPTEPHPDISPLVQYWFPDWNAEEQRAATKEIQPFLKLLLASFEACDQAGLLDDSPDSASRATLGLD